MITVIILQLDSNNDMFELFDIGRSPEPIIVALKNGIIAVQKDDMTVLLNTDGKPAKNFTITWSDTPTNTSKFIRLNLLFLALLYLTIN